MSDDPRRTGFCTPTCYRECQCSRWPGMLDRWGNPVNHGQVIDIACMFGDANGTSLNTYSWANVGDKRPGTAQWVEVLGDWDIQAGQANCVAVVGAAALKAAAVLDCGVADCYISMEHTPANGPGAVLRYQDTDNAWLIAISTVTNAMYLYEGIAGVWTIRTFIDVPVLVGTTYTLRVQLTGQIIRCALDAYETSYGYATTLQTMTSHGLRGFAAGERIDNFLVKPAANYPAQTEPFPPVLPPIAASTQANINTLRAACITEIWTGGGLPVAGADHTTVGVADPLTTSPSNLLSVDQFTFHMDDNGGGWVMDSLPYVWYPTVATSNGKLVLYHMGHTPDWELAGGGDCIRGLVQAGYTVCGFMMPDNGDVVTHNTYTDLPALNYLKFFVEPVVRAINELAAGFTAVYMTGLSGGGWTTVLCTAIDTRITRSIDINGTFPQYIPFSRDFEQLLPGLAASLDYQDLYIMCSDAGRWHIQLNGEFDPAGRSRANYTMWGRYTPTVQGTLAGIAGAGSFALEWDGTTFQHEISVHMLARILAIFT